MKRLRAVAAAAIPRLGLALFGIALACVALEIFLRVTDPIPEVGSPPSNFHDSDPYLGWMGKPNVRLRYRRPQFDTLVEHDAGGWRQPEPLRPPAPVRRVLVLGDSFTWGWGVSQGEVFTDLLQARVAPTVAIFNRGVIGFGTAQEYLLLQRELAAARYDDVVLMFFLNDVADNTDGKDGHRPYYDLVDGQLVPRNQPALAQTDPLELFCKTHSRAYGFIEFALGQLKRWFSGESKDERNYREWPTSDFHDLPGYAVTERLLDEMNRLVRAHGARFFVVYIPHRSEMELDQPYPYAVAVRALIDDVTRSKNIPLVDLTPAFRQQARSGHELVFPIDAHWTPAGHRLTADVLSATPPFQISVANQ